MNLIIIEDDEIVAAQLTRMIAQVDPNSKVLKIADSVASSLSWFESNPMPDLIFSDIYLPDGTSFEIFRHLEDYSPVVFCTAHDQYALEAFNSNGIDYLLKPISEEGLNQCFEKISKIRQSASQKDTLCASTLKALSQIMANYRKSLIVYDKDKIIVVDVKDIFFLVSDKNGSALTTAQSTYSLEGTLDQIMPTLEPQFFFRANRQYIIHRQSIKHIESLPFRKLAVTLADNKTSVVISKEKRKDFISWLEGL
jgi:DNA-binding LytR/AlgR family response regulator